VLAWRKTACAWTGSEVPMRVLDKLGMTGITAVCDGTYKPKRRFQIEKDHSSEDGSPISVDMLRAITRLL
jgi:hypothetical protein